MISSYLLMTCLVTAADRLVRGFSIHSVFLPPWKSRSSRDGSLFKIKRGVCCSATTVSRDDRDVQRQRDIFDDEIASNSRSKGLSHDGVVPTEGELVYALQHSIHDQNNKSFRDLEAALLREQTPEELAEMELCVVRQDNAYLNGFNYYDPLGLSSHGLDVATRSSDDSSNTESNKEVSSGADNDDRQVWIARSLVLISAVLYGTNFTFVKMLSDSIPVGVGAALRFSLASFATLYWLVQPVDTKHDDYKENTSPWGATLAGLEVGMWNACGYMAQAVGLQTTEASKSAFICSLAVVVVPILDSLTGKRMSGKSIIGAAMALFGVAMLEIGDGDIHSALSISPGDTISLVQPFVFGMGFWRMEDAMHKYPSEAPRLTAAQLVSVAAVSVSYCVLGGGGVPPPDMHQIKEWVTDPSIVGALVWTGLVTTALTIYLETLALKILSAAETTLLFSTEPLWGAAFATLMLSEKLGFGAAVGATLILGGIYVTNSSTEHGEEINTPKEGKDNTILISGGVGIPSLVSILQQSTEMESNEIQAFPSTVIAATDATKDILIER